MIAAIIIFFFVLVIAFGMIGFRIWQLQTGRILNDASYEESDWTELSVEIVRAHLLEWTKIAIHHGILYSLKGWIKFSAFLKRTDYYIRKKLMHFLHKNGHLPEGGKPSIFLKRITAHKNELSAAAPKTEDEVAKTE
jgi:hypothetical protein